MSRKDYHLSQTGQEVQDILNEAQRVYTGQLSDVTEPDEGDICIVPEHDVAIPIAYSPGIDSIDLDVPYGTLKWSVDESVQTVDVATIKYMNTLVSHYFYQPLPAGDETPEEYSGQVTSQVNDFHLIWDDDEIFAANVDKISLYSSVPAVAYEYRNGEWVERKDMSDVLRYSAQSLTAAQQSQARENITAFGGVFENKTTITSNDSLAKYIRYNCREQGVHSFTFNGKLSDGDATTALNKVVVITAPTYVGGSGVAISNFAQFVLVEPDSETGFEGRMYRVVERYSQGSPAATYALEPYYIKPSTGIPAADLAEGVVSDVVRHSQQSLTAAQRAQARANIMAEPDWRELPVLYSGANISESEKANNLTVLQALVDDFAAGNLRPKVTLYDAGLSNPVEVFYAYKQGSEYNIIAYGFVFYFFGGDAMEIFLTSTDGVLNAKYTSYQKVPLSAPFTDAELAAAQEGVEYTIAKTAGGEIPTTDASSQNNTVFRYRQGWSYGFASDARYSYDRHYYDVFFDLDDRVIRMRVYRENNRITILWKKRFSGEFSDLKNKPTTISGYGITDAYTKTEVDKKISVAYKAAGSAASVAALGSLDASHEGFVYNMSAEFTTTADFVEGAGKTYPAGTNVAIVNNGTAQSPVYKYDVLVGYDDKTLVCGVNAIPNTYSETKDLTDTATAFGITEDNIRDLFDGKYKYIQFGDTTLAITEVTGGASKSVKFGSTEMATEYILYGITIMAGMLVLVGTTFYKGSAVLYTEQNLSAAQQLQARTNIGATAPEIFWATYGTTTAAQVADAVSAGKAVMVNYSSGIFFLSHIDGSYYYFESVFTNRLRVIKLKISDNTWSGITNTYCEDTSNKVNTLTGNETSTTKYPSTKAVYDALQEVNGTDLSPEIDNAEFTYRGLQPASSAAVIKKIFGRTLVWNQMVNAATMFPASSGSTLTFTNNNDGSITVNGTATSDTFLAASHNLSVIADHKYLLLGTTPGGAKANSYDATIWGSTGKVAPAICTARSSGNIAAGTGLRIYVPNGSTCNNEKIWPMFIDLTAEFGAGSEPATVEEFERLYYLKYFGYDPGSLVHNAATGLEVVGRNVWDEEWENGEINTATGGDTENNNKIRSKNYINVIPGETYYFKCPVKLNVFFYDASEAFLGSGWWTADNGPINNTKTIPSGVYKLRFSTQGSTVTTYANDICINLSDTSFNGQYEPYRKTTVALNLATKTGKLNGEGSSVAVFSATNTGAAGMKSAGTTFDEATKEKGIVRLKQLDLGTLTWTKYDNGTAQYFASTAIADAKPAAANTSVGNLVCTKYSITTAASLASAISNHGDKLIAITNDKVIRIYDSAYASGDAAAFKTAMSGVPLVYELATPLEYVWDTPLDLDYPSGTTEKRLPEDTASAVNAPFVADIQYGLTTEEILEAAAIDLTEFTTQELETLWTAAEEE